MAKLVVTGLELETKMVTIDAPHGDLLARAAAALAYWQEEAERLAEEMGPLSNAGVFLDDDGIPVVPSWWDRQDRPSLYLIWPAAYARKMGIPRRQRVEAEEYEVLESKRMRTIAYSNLKAKHDRLVAQIEHAGQDLIKLAERYGW